MFYRIPLPSLSSRLADATPFASNPTPPHYVHRVPIVTESRRWPCVPLAVETFGAWCEEGDKANCKLAGAVAARTNVPTVSGSRRPVWVTSPSPCSGRTRAPWQRRYEFTRPALGWGLAIGRSAAGRGAG